MVPEFITAQPRGKVYKQSIEPQTHLSTNERELQNIIRYNQRDKLCIFILSNICNHYSSHYLLCSYFLPIFVLYLLLVMVTAGDETTSSADWPSVILPQLSLDSRHGLKFTNVEPLIYLKYWTKKMLYFPWSWVAWWYFSNWNFKLEFKWCVNSCNIFLFT